MRTSPKQALARERNWQLARIEQSVATLEHIARQAGMSPSLRKFHLEALDSFQADLRDIVDKKYAKDKQKL